MNLRAATMVDIPVIEALIVDSGIALSRGFYSDVEARAITAEVFGVDTQLIVDGTYFVIEDDGVVVASGGWSRRGTLYGSDGTKRAAVDPLLDPAVDPARIRAFFVASSQARRGLGSRLMEHCADAAWHAGFRRLTLMATLPGVPLYRVFGFEPEEELALALTGGVYVALVRMSRALDGPTLRPRSAFG